MNENNSACITAEDVFQSNIWYSEIHKKVAFSLSAFIGLIIMAYASYSLHYGEAFEKPGVPEVKNISTELETKPLKELISKKSALRSDIWNVDPHLEKLVNKKILIWQLSVSGRTGKRPLDNISEWLSNVSIYREYIADAAAKYSIDENFLTALFAWESRGNPRAKSIKAARGFGQFMRVTASEKGLVVNDAIDERLDPSKAIYAAASYIRDAATRYGDYSFLVTAYYNYGPGNVRKNIRRYGLKESLFYRLPKETQQHYTSIFAIKKLLDSPEVFGFSYEVKPSFKAIVKNAKPYTIQQGEDLYAVAERHNVDLEIILYKNPRIFNHKRLRQGTVIKI